MRSLSKLLHVTDPAWLDLSASIEAAGPAVVVLPVEIDAGEECLHQLQVTARSTLGALALHTGGLSIDGGWLRILGGGSDFLPSLAEANAPELDGSAQHGFLLVAFDVLGGRFAINGDGLDGEPGEIHYWAPDTLTWSSLGVRHSQFVSWCLGSGVAEFYLGLRWRGWEDEVRTVGLHQGLSIYPPLCTAESRPIESTTRQAVLWRELTGMLDHLSNAPEGPFQITVD